MTLQYLQFACLRTFINASLFVRRSSWLSPDTQPTRTQVFASRHDLFAARIFAPADELPGERLPLLIDVHGGGFLLNNPSADDPLSRQMSDLAKCLVVSLDYRKAPTYKFPAAYDDIVQQILAILDGSALTFDPNRVILCGSSAGGNLVLGVAQHPSLRHRILGLIGLYPLCDLVPSGVEKLATRPDPSVPDFLGSSYDRTAALYLEAGEDAPDLKDTRLSPTYFGSREHIPAQVLIFGCEHDMLCHEAEIMAGKLAGDISKDENEHGWQAGTVQWRFIRGQTHAFDHFAAKNVEDEKRRMAAREETYDVICNWLVGLFDTKDNVDNRRS